MALSDLAYIRLILSVPHRPILAEELGSGDGTNKKFMTQLSPIIAESETIRVDGTVKTRTTDYAIDNAFGLVTFVTAPADGKLVDADYKWSVFSDTEINGLLARYNDSVYQVLKQLVRALLSNSDLFIKYTVGMESVDRSQALSALKALQKDLAAEVPTALAQAVIWTQSDVDIYERDVPWADFVDSTPED